VRGRDYAWGLGGEDTYAYARCRECNTLVLDPRPGPEEIGFFYSRYHDRRMIEAYRETYRRLAPRSAGFLDIGRTRACMSDQAATGTPFAAGMRVLDVGCSYAGFLRFLRDFTGVEVRGVDFDPACSEVARQIHGVDVGIGTLDDQHHPDGSFDVVTCHHCLEHVYDPAADLREIARVVRPGGFLHVEVPTRGVLGWLFGGRWAFLQPPTHFFHYRPATLRALVEAAGFEVLAVKRPWLPGELSFSLLQLAGVRATIPVMSLRADSWRARMIRFAFVITLLFDLPVTALLAVLKAGGIVRIIARRRG
jgi:2-polyprenyl-3-methyl-5-hydroxy-6-metoxy-1,4-benzoquinol methylase